MKIEIVTLIEGSEIAAGDGITGAQRCVITLPDGQKRAGVIKRGPVGQISSEAFCALLLKAWGLSVPDPYLIDESSGPAFVSADISYPNLKQCLSVESLPDGLARDAALKIACALACSLPTSPLAAACDEAIDNRDRNLGNILWDGQSEAWIDHAFSLGEGAHMADSNKLCDMAQFTENAEKNEQRSSRPSASY
jgi:hypothetical protein